MPAVEKTDSYAALVERLGRWILLAGAVSWVYVAVRWGWKGAAGFAFGVIGAYFNMRWLANGLVRPKGVAAGLFFGYSLLNGLTLSSIFFVYQIGSVVTAFVVAAGMFGAMAVYGLVTKKDLTSWGSFFFMGLNFTRFILQRPRWQGTAQEKEQYIVADICHCFAIDCFDQPLLRQRI